MQSREYQTNCSPIDLLTRLLTDAPDLSVLQDEPSWNRIKEHSGRYGVAALVAYVARAHVSPVERQWCDRILIDSWTRHERRLRDLEYLLSLFAAEGIRTIVLKGPLLARRYYTPPFLRKPSLDLDLAVVEDDLERACRVLAGVGYKQDMPVRDARVLAHHVELSHPSRPSVELHFRLSHRALGIPVAGFFDRAVTFRLPNGQDADVLGPADQLLHLVLHLAQSRFGTLFHLCEIRRVCKAESLAVRAEAIERAVEHGYCGAVQMIDIAFRLHWGDSFVPLDVLVPRTWLNWRLTPDLYRAFERFSSPGRGLTLASRVYARWLDFQLTSRPADAIRAAAFFIRTAGFYLTVKHAWGTPRHIHFPADVPRSVETKRER
jgi:hypothetical protein